MTSSFVDPPTVRPNFCRRSSSLANQHTSFTDDSVCCGSQESHYQQHHRDVSQASLDDRNIQFQWAAHDAQPKREYILLCGYREHLLILAAWLTPSDNTWYPQASPGANGHGYMPSAWDSSVSQTYLNPTMGGGHYVHINQPTTNDWLLQRSYHGAQDVTGHQIPWTYNPTSPDYNGSYQPHAEGRLVSDDSADVPCSDTGHAQFATTSASINHYSFASHDEAQAREGYYPTKHDVGVWDWSQAMSPTAPLIRTDMPVQDLGHSPEHGRISYFSKLDTSVVIPRAQISPTSSSWDIDDNASLATTNTTTLTDLIPDPPTDMVDPPSADMNPKDKTMVPQRRNLKDPNHLYMPRWIRGDGKQREGWCGACRPGKWLSLKRSTYWCR